MISVRQFEVGGFDKNLAYVIYDTVSKEAYIVDPSGSILPALNLIQDQQLSLRGILLTHTHQDHYDQLDEILNVQKVPVFVHEKGVRAISGTTVYPLQDGQQIPVGEQVISVLHTPGHSPDSMCFFIPAEASEMKIPYLISGDTLFVKGCGKTDETQVGELFTSLQRLKELPDETVVFPGHDYGQSPRSSLALEKTQNLYLMSGSLEAFTKLRLPEEAAEQL